VLIAHKLSCRAAGAKGGGSCGEAARPAFYAGAIGARPRPDILDRPRVEQ